MTKYKHTANKILEDGKIKGYKYVIWCSNYRIKTPQIFLYKLLLDDEKINIVDNNKIFITLPIDNPYNEVSEKMYEEYSKETIKKIEVYEKRVKNLKDSLMFVKKCYEHTFDME